MVDVEVLGAHLAPDAPSRHEIRSLCESAAASRGVSGGHVAIEFVDEARIAELNLRHRGRRGATDVLSFPIDGVAPLSEPGRPGAAREHGGPPRELGDVVICPARASDLREAIVHGMLHLLGMDHETDAGEMLALQARLLAQGQP